MCGEGSQERQAVQLRKSKRPTVERIGIQRGNWRIRERDRRTSMRSCKSNERRYSRITRGIVMCKATEKFCIAIACCRSRDCRSCSITFASRTLSPNRKNSIASPSSSAN